MSSANKTVKFTIQGEARMKKMTRDVQASMDRITNSMRSVNVAIGLITGAGGIGLLINKHIEGARQALVYSDALNVSVESLTAWQFAGQAVGIQADKMGDIMKDVAEKIGDAYRNNGGEAKEALNGLNLSIADMAKLSPDQQLLQIADALKSVQTQGEKVQIMEALANDATLLLPLLKDDAKELKRLFDLADRTGASMNRIEAEKLMAVGRQTKELSAAMEGLGRTIVLELAEPMTRFILQVSEGFPMLINGIYDFFNETDREALNAATKRLKSYREEWERLSMAKEQGTVNPILRGEIDRDMDAAMQKIIATRKEIERLQNQLDGVRMTPIEITPQQGNSGPQVGGSDNTKIDAQIAASLDRVRQSLMSEEQALEQSFINKRAIIDEAWLTDYIKESERDELYQQLAIEHQAKLTEIKNKGLSDRQKFQALSGKMQTKTVIGDLINMTAGVAQQNRKMFEINKAAGIANAVINTYEGVTQALKAYPPPLSGIMAGIQLAAGMAQVNAIKSSKFGGGSVNSTAAPSSAGSTPAPAVTPILPTGADTQQPTGTNITINITGNAIGDDAVRATIIDAIEQAQANDEIRILTDG